MLLKLVLMIINSYAVPLGTMCLAVPVQNYQMATAEDNIKDTVVLLVILQKMLLMEHMITH